MILEDLKFVSENCFTFKNATYNNAGSQPTMTLSQYKP